MDHVVEFCKWELGQGQTRQIMVVPNKTNSIPCGVRVSYLRSIHTLRYLLCDTVRYRNRVKLLQDCGGALSYNVICDGTPQIAAK